MSTPRETDWLYNAPRRAMIATKAAPQLPKKNTEAKNSMTWFELKFTATRYTARETTIRTMEVPIRNTFGRPELGVFGLFLDILRSEGRLA